MGMDPFTVGLIFTALSGGVTAYGQKQAAKSQASLARFNQEQLRIAGENANAEAEAKAQATRRSGKKKIASLRAQQAAKGSIGNEASIQQLVDEDRLSELEALDIQRQGTIAKQGFNTKAEISGIEAKSARRRGRTQVATTLFNTGDKAFTQLT